MKKQVEKIIYKLKVSKRARRMRLAVYCDGSCVITVPKTMPGNLIEKFIVGKSQWVVDKIDFFRKLGYRPRRTSSRAEFAKYKDRAMEIARSRIEYFNRAYKFSINKINIKNQKTRWGSCSKKGNLNFNYKIALLPQAMSDYIIIHELCHLGEFNHSQNFWNLVAQYSPDYLDIRSKLKRNDVRNCG